MTLPLDPQRADLLHHRLLEWYEAQGRDLPWRRTRDPYAILVAEVMLHQTPVRRVVPKFREFLGRFPTWEALARASPGEVLRAWAPLGYNRRALYLHRLAQEVVRRGGDLPREEGALRRLPGIGRYTASALLCFAFGEDRPVVDTNIRRVLGRLLFGPGPVPQGEVERAAAALLPRGDGARWAQALMDLGATLCLLRRPLCPLCPVGDLCRSAPFFLGQVGETPALDKPRQGPFKGSDRYYRGRVLALLRSLPAGRGVPLSEALRALGSDGPPEGLPRLRRIAEGLHRDGLIALKAGMEGSPEDPILALPE